MQVLEAGEVAAGEDQVHALLVLDVEVADGLAALVDDAEAQLLGAAAAQLGLLDDDAQVAGGDAEAADRVGRHVLALRPPCARSRRPAGFSPCGLIAPPASAAPPKRASSRAAKAVRRAVVVIWSREYGEGVCESEPYQIPPGG